MAKKTPVPNPYGELHPTDVSAYEEVRPKYPHRAVLAALRSPSRSVDRVADIGSGTGKFARQVVDLLPNVRVEAIEPSAAMRAKNEADPRIRVRPGSAEKTGLPSGAVDLVVWAQSFHWVDRAAAGRETSRILRPGGAGVVLVNQMDTALPRVHRLTRIMRSGDVIRPNWHPTLPGFVTGPVATYPWVQELSVAGVLSLARTRSSYLGADAATRERMQRNLRWYLEDHLGHLGPAPVRIPYLTYLWVLRPAGA